MKETGSKRSCLVFSNFGRKRPKFFRSYGRYKAVPPKCFRFHGVNGETVSHHMTKTKLPNNGQ